MGATYGASLSELMSYNKTATNRAHTGHDLPRHILSVVTVPEELCRKPCMRITV